MVLVKVAPLGSDAVNVFDSVNVLDSVNVFDSVGVNVSVGIGMHPSIVVPLEKLKFPNDSL